MRDIRTRELRADLEAAGHVGAVTAGEREDTATTTGVDGEGVDAADADARAGAGAGGKRGRGWEGAASAGVLAPDYVAAVGVAGRRKRRRTASRRRRKQEEEEEDEGAGAAGKSSGTSSGTSKSTKRSKAKRATGSASGAAAMEDDAGAGDDEDEDEDEDEVADPDAPAPRLSVGMIRRILQEGEHLPVAFPERERLKERIQFVDRLSRRICEHLPNMPGHPRGVSGNRLPQGFMLSPHALVHRTAVVPGLPEASQSIADIVNGSGSGSGQSATAGSQSDGGNGAAGDGDKSAAELHHAGLGKAVATDGGVDDPSVRPSTLHVSYLDPLEGGTLGASIGSTSSSGLLPGYRRARVPLAHIQALSMDALHCGVGFAEAEVAI